MSGGGYTPLFGSLTTGTLCGKWPDIGLWPIVLSLTDRHGTVDVTPQYIAGVTGLALDEVIACMGRFCEPDPGSRSPDDDGRRLVLLDPEHRSWGWRVVNHGRYRERARKAAYDADRTSSGADAERKRRQRTEARDVPTSPDESRALPLSDTNTDSNTNTDPEGKKDIYALLDELKAIYPARTGGQPWAKARSAINARLTEGISGTELIEGAKRYAAYCDATGTTGTQYVMQAVRFCGPDLHFREPWTPPRNKGRVSEREQVLDRFARKGGGDADE